MALVTIYIDGQSAISIERCFDSTEILLIAIEDKEVREMLIHIPVKGSTVLAVHIEDGAVFFEIGRLYAWQCFLQSIVHVTVDLLKYLIHLN